MLVLGLFVRWTERREKNGLDPLFRLGLFDINPLRGGLQMFLAQNIILMGVFFSIPLYLQVVQGLDALETGLKMLPVSVTMFVMSFVGARMSQRRTPQWIVRVGLWILLGAIVVLIGTIEPSLEGYAFGLSMALLGVGMGLLASQLGNVVQSSVEPADRSEAGGLQYTSQQLGSSLGTALIGAVVLSVLATGFFNQLNSDPRISDSLAAEISADLAEGVEFVNADDVRVALEENGTLSDDEVDAIVETLEESELTALRTGLLVAAFVVIGALFMVRRIPDMSFEEIAAAEAD